MHFPSGSVTHAEGTGLSLLRKKVTVVGWFDTLGFELGRSLNEWKMGGEKWVHGAICRKWAEIAYSPGICTWKSAWGQTGRHTWFISAHGMKMNELLCCFPLSRCFLFVFWKKSTYEGKALGISLGWADGCTEGFEEGCADGNIDGTPLHRKEKHSLDPWHWMGWMV